MAVQCAAGLCDIEIVSVSVYLYYIPEIKAGFFIYCLQLRKGHCKYTVRCMEVLFTPPSTVGAGAVSMCPLSGVGISTFIWQ